MSMTEPPITAPAAKPKKKPKPRKKVAKRAAPPPAAKQTDEFAGLTAKLCCAACNADRCVISGQNYCGHPGKGGLQGPSAHDGAAVRRSQAAKKILGRKMLDDRHS